MDAACVLVGDGLGHLGHEFALDDLQHLRLRLWLQPVVSVIFLVCESVLRPQEVLGAVEVLVPKARTRLEVLLRGLQERHLKAVVVDSQIPGALPHVDALILHRFRIDQAHVDKDFDGLLGGATVDLLTIALLANLGQNGS